MVVSELEAAGITALIPDEFIAEAMAFNPNAVGYVRVQVSPRDYEAAKDVIEDAERRRPNLLPQEAGVSLPALAKTIQPCNGSALVHYFRAADGLRRLAPGGFHYPPRQPDGAVEQLPDIVALADAPA